MPTPTATPPKRFRKTRMIARCLSIFFLAFFAVVHLGAGETLYNGIELPDEWPPRPESFARAEPVVPPYLSDPPAVIPIDVGRQLFVDDFLIDETENLSRTFHQPKWHSDNPVFQAETLWEKHRVRDLPFAAPFSDGIWWDPADGVIKMWYMAGTVATFGYATSIDGINWERPVLNAGREGGENIIFLEPFGRDSSTVWLDLDAERPARRYKMMYYRAGLQMRTSADGINWSESYGKPGGSSDRSTFFYNPFRKRWVFSIRGNERDVGRCRFYAENEEFRVRNQWQSYRELPRWTCADALDKVRDVAYVDDLPDLYNVDAIAYESLLLGQFSIHAKEAEGGRPKINYVTLGYSRDGFHWHRPDRRPFLDVSDDPKAWNYGNVQSAGGGCLVMGDQLYFYCSGRNSGRTPDDGSGASTGLAILRRDGFASMDTSNDKTGTLTTRPIRFRGEYLFVNVASSGSANPKLIAEILDAENNVVIDGFSAADCLPVTTDSTRAAVAWNNARLSALMNRAVRLRFHLDNASLYSFWVSPDKTGASHGYVAGGGPGFTGHRDTVGKRSR